jgi:hypothetical protein
MLLDDDLAWLANNQISFVIKFGGLVPAGLVFMG